MANVIYNAFKANLHTIDWSDNAGTDIKVMLVTSAYTYDIDLHEFIDDVTNEITGVGYTAGGVLTATRTVTRNDGTNEVFYDADDATWTSSTITARGAVVYVDSGAPSTSPLICYVDFLQDKSSDLGNFVVQWGLEGVFKIA